MEISLRAATADDLAAVVAIDNVSFKQPWSPRSFEKALQDEKTDVLVAQSAGRVVGFGVAYAVGDEGEIATLAVDGTARGQGLGERIVRALLELCNRRGARKVFLEVRVSNSSAQRLYERCGFVEVGRRRRYYADGEDAIVMCWEKDE
jgi:ribosomal-protein-alanine N-acetyltransferase